MLRAAGSDAGAGSGPRSDPEPLAAQDDTQAKENA